MAKVVKLKDKFNAYLDDGSIKHGDDILKDRLNRLQLYAFNKNSITNNYIEYSIKPITTGGRFAYFYMGITNNAVLVAGIIGIHNGNVLKHTPISGNTNVTLVDNHTIKISGLDAYSIVTLIGYNPIIS